MTAIEELRRLGAERQRLEDELKAVREAIPEAAHRAAAEGARQIDMVHATGYTREMVRRMFVPPKPGTRRRRPV